jgi:hypothetical protein
MRQRCMHIWLRYCEEPRPKVGAFSRNDRQAMIRFGGETNSGYTLSAGSTPENMKLEDLYVIVEAVRE